MAKKNSKSKKTQDMIDNFMVYVKEGYTLKQIAQRCDLNFTTVTKHLDEIATLNNTTKRDLLRIIKRAQIIKAHNSPAIYKAADDIDTYTRALNNLNKRFESTEEDFYLLLSKLNSKLSDLKDINFIISETENLLTNINNKLSYPKDLSLVIKKSGKLRIFPEDFSVDINDCDYYMNKLLNSEDIDVKAISDKNKVALAQALSIINKLDENGMEYKISFEIKKVGILFEKLKSVYNN